MVFLSLPLYKVQQGKKWQTWIFALHTPWTVRWPGSQVENGQKWPKMIENGRKWQKSSPRLFSRKWCFRAPYTIFLLLILLCFDYFHYPSLAICINIKMKWPKTTKPKNWKQTMKDKQKLDQTVRFIIWNKMIASLINVVVNVIQESNLNQQSNDISNGFLLSIYSIDYVMIVVISSWNWGV